MGVFIRYDTRQLVSFCLVDVGRAGADGLVLLGSWPAGAGLF